MAKVMNGVKDRIQRRRRAEELPVSSLATLSGIADKTLRRRLEAPDKFTLEELASIARVLGVDLEYILLGHELPAELEVAG